MTRVVLAPSTQLEITLPDRQELAQQTLATGSANDASFTSEFSLDILTKECADAQRSSSTSCRWDPNDSDYSLNVLLPPTREESPETEQRGSFGVGSASGDDSATTASKDSLLGSDYSLNKLRSRSKVGKPLYSSSSFSSSSSSSSLGFDGSSDLDLHSSSRLAVPSNISVAQASSPNNGSSKRPTTTKVSFYPRVRIQRIPPRKQLPREVVHAVWYSREEFSDIRQECFDTIKLMRDDDEHGRADEIDPLYDEEGNVLCRRGLEYKTPQAYKKRQKQKKEIRAVVFDEQDFQDEADMNDPEWLAKLSRDQSRSCVRAAIVAAEEDARQARNHFHDVDSL